MNLFNKSKSMEEIFMRHMEKEEESFKTLIKSLNDIKEEIHKTNTHIVEIDASHTLKLVEAKSQILEMAFDRLVEQKEYNLKVKELESDIVTLKEDVNSKVSKREVKVAWGFLITLAGLFSWKLS